MGNCCQSKENINHEDANEVFKETDINSRNNHDNLNSNSSMFPTEKPKDTVSYKIYKIINEMRTKPELYLEESKKYEELFKPFAKAVDEAIRPKELFYNERDSEKVEEYFKLMENNDKTNMEKQNDISKLLNKNGYFYFSFGDGNKITENVWNLLDNNAEEAFQILTENYKEIVIAITPIEGTSKFVITYIFSK